MRRGLVAVVIVALLGCGDSGEGDTGTDAGSTASTGGSTVTTGGPTTSTTGSTGPTATGSTTAPSTGSSGGSSGVSTSSGGADSSGSGDSGSGTTGPMLDCTLPAPPLAFELFTDVFAESEDLVFDGAGNMLGKQGDYIIAVDSAGLVAPFATVPGLSYGLRMMQNGDAVIARWVADVVTRVPPGGAPVDIATGLTIPNGLFVDLDDRVWITDPGRASIFRVETDGSVTLVIAGAEASGVGGIVYDEDRSLLWFTYYDAGQLRRLSIDGMGNAGAFEIVLTADGWLHGLALDQCGHLYLVDHRDNELLRLELDAAGDPVGDPVLLAQLPTFVYSAQFGKGNGFSPTSLYLIGGPGSVYHVDVGIAGASVPPV